MNHILVKILALTAGLFLSSQSFAQTCPVCTDVNRLLAKMAQVEPNPMAEEKEERLQTQLAHEASDILAANLNEKDFNKGTAKAIVKLIARAIPYDNALDLEDANRAAFLKLYKKKNSLLKSTIEEMEKSGEISATDKKDILELFGAIPSTK